MTQAGLEQLPNLLVSRRWWQTTLLVVATMVIMVQLGFWQLDRLENRRARNAAITRQLTSEPLLLSEINLDDPSSLEYRPASAHGIYDHSREIILKGQAWRGQPGIHLLTPLMISGSDRTVLVDRGWIPYDAAGHGTGKQFAEPGHVSVTGLIRSSEAVPEDATPPAKPQSEWYRVDIAAIQIQMPYELLPIYVQQSPSQGGNIDPPVRTQPTFDLSEGRHLGYAIQWYLFAIVLGVGYLQYLRKNASTG